MRAFGMTPVLPAFAGFVPQAIKNKYPNASISRLGNWGSFPDKFCCVHLLDPQDPLFQQIGQAFVQVGHVKRCVCVWVWGGGGVGGTAWLAGWPGLHAGGSSAPGAVVTNGYTGVPYTSESTPASAFSRGADNSHLSWR